LEYVTEHLFKNILGVDFILSENRQAYLNHTGTCINYSPEDLNYGFQILPFGLLEKKGVAPIKIGGAHWEDLFCFFTSSAGDIPFDIFSASFYLLTSYEEYVSTSSDLHSRFPFEDSTAYKNGFLEIPLVDRWAYKLKGALIEKFGEAGDYKLRSYRFLSTFDIDYPYQYRNKGITKNIVGSLRDLSAGKFSKFVERLKVITHLEEDPYLKAIQWIDHFHKKQGRHYYLFILLSKYGKYGRKTIYPLRKYYLKLRSLENVTIGLHPSYESFLDWKKTNREKQKLEKILGKEVSVGRWHFLRIRFPETFRILNELNFAEDFSLAYAKSPGFRSGTAVPYYFYDLNEEVCTHLRIQPTIVMDTCLMIHRQLDPEEAFLKIKHLALECKKSGGDFVMIWHNNNLAGNSKKNTWLNLFIRSFEYAISLENGNFGAEKITNKLNVFNEST
jgi:hypothetical protein